MKKSTIIKAVSLALVTGAIASVALLNEKTILAISCTEDQSDSLSYSESEQHEGTIKVKVPQKLREGSTKLLGFTLTFDGRQAIYKIPEGKLGATVSIPVVREYDPDTVGNREYWNNTVLDNLLWESGTTPEERVKIIKSFTEGGNLVLDAVVGTDDSSINSYAYASDSSLVKYSNAKNIADSPTELLKVLPETSLDVFDQSVCLAPQTIWGTLEENYYQVDSESNVMNPANDIQTGAVSNRKKIPIYTDKSLSEFVSPVEVENSILIGWNKEKVVLNGEKLSPEVGTEQLEPHLEVGDSDDLSYHINYFYQIDGKTQISDDSNRIDSVGVK